MQLSGLFFSEVQNAGHLDAMTFYSVSRSNQISSLRAVL